MNKSQYCELCESNARKLVEKDERIAELGGHKVQLQESCAAHQDRIDDLKIARDSLQARGSSSAHPGNSASGRAAA